MTLSPPTAQKAPLARVILLIVLGIVVNLGLGTLVIKLKIPLFLDAIGTLAVVLLAGFRAGAMTGVVTCLVGGVLVTPVLPWYSGTQFLIAAYLAFVANRGWLTIGKTDGHPGPAWQRVVRLLLIGMGLGILAGTVSAPVSVSFSDFTNAGPARVGEFFHRYGQTFYRSVLLSGFASEPLDKMLQLLLALGLVRVIPPTLRTSFGGGYLKQNGLTGTRD